MCVFICVCVYIGCIIILYRREASIGLIVTYVIHVQNGRTAFYMTLCMYTQYITLYCTCGMMYDLRVSNIQVVM